MITSVAPATGFGSYPRVPARPVVAVILVCLMATAAEAAGSLQVCVRRDDPELEEFNATFARGPVVLPPGVVFDLAGHTFGGAADPLDGMHMGKGSDLGWKGITKVEEERRGRLMLDDSKRDQKHKSGLVTLSEIRLTKARPCATVAVAAVLSGDWGWTVSPVFGDTGIYYQTYGVIHGGVLNTDWTKEPPSLGEPALGGALNGILQGTTDRIVTIGSGG